MPRKLRLGTRGSRLAMAQAENIRDMIQEANSGIEVEIVPIKTSGDRGQRDQLGAFVREIQQALLSNEVDLAQHCLKDLPTEQVPGLTLAAYLEREDPRDALISRGPELDELPEGAVVGTGSVRRTSQIASKYPELRFKPLLGNIDTRMRKLMGGEYDAIILATAGLRRLGVLDSWEDSEYRELIVRPIDVETMLPAPGQAVIVLETRQKDEDTQKALRTMHHPASKVCADAERVFLKAFGGGCSVPVAALATLQGSDIALTGLVASPDGAKVIRRTMTDDIDNADALAHKMAQEMIAEGAAELFQPVASLRGGTEH